MKNNNEKKDKKILIGALGVAAVIAAGSTFAWFTSSDEVTNRLTASADYGVSISESFTPPTEWLPGQEIKKEVAAVNTGNIAAYVRLDLKHALQGTQAGDGVAYSSSVATTGLTPLTANEIKTLEAGGYLAYTDAEDVPTGAVTATPTAKGLYIYRRQITDGLAYSGYYCDGAGNYYGLVTTKLDNGDITVDAVLTPTNAAAAAGDADYGKLSAVSGVKLQNTKALVTGDPTSTLAKKAASGKWTSAEWADATHILVTYPGADTTSALKTNDDIVFVLELDENAKTNWTYKKDLANDGTDVDGYFYYNSLVAAGATTEKLITSVTLDDSVQAGAYLDITYDLTVGLDSVQMTKNEGGTYQSNSITPWVAGATVDGGTGAPNWG